jgi:phosphoribosyl-AMP cyclohydrolase / phosphoribosyl-ATP pyrophosphohydrolase
MTMTINHLDRMPGGAEALIRATTFDAGELVPVIAQDARTGSVRMFAWANREALLRTVETGLAHFWSRSRQAIWRKGETSGNVLRVRDIRLDCDGDAVLYVTDAEGPSCHTGRTSCFFRGLRAAAGGDDGGATVVLAEDDGAADPPAVVVSRVADVIARRRRERPEKSYVVSLLDAGWPKILGKIIEESGELVDALPEGDSGHTAHEAADLIFHMLVGLESAGVPLEDVFAQLRRRFGVSGIDEKASRPKADGAAQADDAAEPTPPKVTPPAKAAGKVKTKANGQRKPAPRSKPVKRPVTKRVTGKAGPKSKVHPGKRRSSTKSTQKQAGRRA